MSTSQGDSDAELAVQLRNGDAAALGELYDRHVGGIHDFLARFTRDPAAAEDLAHSTFLRAWERRSTLREPSRVRAWLYATAHHLALNHLTRGRPVSSIDDETAGRVPDPAPGPEDEAVAREVAELVWAAASSLGARQYAVLDLSVRHGLSTREIADVLEVPVGHAAVLVNRAREALGNAVRYLLVARRRDHCERLAALVPAGVRALTAQQRSAVDHHMRRCESCQELGRRLTAPAQLLGALLPVPVPASLGRAGRERLVAAVHAAPGAAAAAQSGSTWPPRRPPWDGRGRLVTGIAWALAVLLVGGGVAVHTLRSPGPPGAGQRRGGPVAAGPAAPAPTVTPSPGASPVADASPQASPGEQPAAALGAPASTPVAAVTPRPAPAQSGPAAPPGTPAPAPTRKSTPTPTPVRAPTPSPSPLLSVALSVVACPSVLLNVCVFSVRVTVAGPSSGQIVTGTVTATGARQAAPFQVQIGASGSGSRLVFVSFSGCPVGTASATTAPPNVVSSSVLKFAVC